MNRTLAALRWSAEVFPFLLGFLFWAPVVLLGWAVIVAWWGLRRLAGR